MNEKLLPFDMVNMLNSDEAMSEYLSQVLEDGDSDELSVPWAILPRPRAWQ